ncbi:MAG: LamG-like jellyroll fold domain-containing protein [Planctomycetota bacterium]
MGKWILTFSAAMICSLASAGTIPDDGVLTLDGKTRMVDVNAPALRLAGSPITVQAWFRTQKPEGVIFECGAQNREPGSQAGHALYMKAGGLRFGVNNSAEMYQDELWDDIWTNIRYNDGKWHHATGVFSGDGRTRVTLYVDGVEVTDAKRMGQAQPALSAFTKTDAIARIGSRTGPMIYPRPEEFVWSGSIDEVRVWKRALSAEEVRANWDKEVNPASTDLVGYWKFANKPSELGDAVDDSAMGNDGVVSELKYTFPINAPFFPVDNQTFPTDDFDYSKYPMNMTGYTGQDRQRVALLRWEKAERHRVGDRGNYKPGFTQLPDGRLLVAVCRKSPGYDKDESKRFWIIPVYESEDLGKSWRQINETPLFGKEPALVSTGKGTLVLSAQRGDYRPSAQKGGAYFFRSTDGGKTWRKIEVEDANYRYPYPRNIIVDDDGSLVYLRSCGAGITLCRSMDDGETWTFLDGKVDWNPEGDSYAGQFDEIGVALLPRGRLFASLRVNLPRMSGHAFESTYVTTSDDAGKHWSRPRLILNAGEVQAYPTALPDGRILLTYTNYHLPFGVSAIVSEDGGETWDRERLVQLALSAGDESGWGVTLALKDGSLITAYAITLYREKDTPTTACEVLRWRLP